MQTRNFEGQDGKRVFITEVLAETIQFLESKNNNNRSGSEQASESPEENGEPVDISDDDLPF